MTPVIPEDSWSGGFLVIGPSGKGVLFQLLLCFSSCLINGCFIAGECGKWGELGSPFFQICTSQDRIFSIPVFDDQHGSLKAAFLTFSVN